MRILICSQEAPVGPGNAFKDQLRAVVSVLGADHDLRLLGLVGRGQAEERATPEWQLIPVAAPGSGTQRARSARPRAWAAPASYEPLVEAIRQPLDRELDSFDPDLVYVAGARLAAVGRHLEGRPSVIAPLDAAHLSLEAQAVAAGELL